ncbi:MAG: isochorismate synthase, partial [Candidatus Hydrogenedentes bacterium]|nr:isochorismate synthase [Candidatus Hydrogenedentota bacterium]
LEAQGMRSRGYWCSRERDFELAGVGTADIISAEVECDYEELFDILKAGISSVHPNLRYYGGMRFRQCAPASEKWRPFGAYRFVLPRFEVFTRGAQTYLACNAILDEKTGDLPERILEALRAMPFPGKEEIGAVPALRTRNDQPSQNEWAGEVGRLLHAFGTGAIDKVVLARETEFVFDSPPDPVAILRRLSVDATRTYRYCFQPRADAAFVGASPERLYKRQDQFVRSEAVAGTRPRGHNAAEDESLGRDLLSSEKETREHRYVVDAVRTEFERQCTAVHMESEAALLQLTECQHLHTRIEGILSDGVTDADLLKSLHPTPAVGGSPREEALRWIDEVEPFDRGWYAGPVGWVGSDGAEFAVGIRSALVHENTLSVYAGAGIVAGSDPASEWDELENKISRFVGVLSG